MSYTAKDIRNVCLLGHSGTGKTSLVESMLYMTGSIDRLGKVTEGNTVCDSDPEEAKRQISISLAVAPVQFKGCKINVLDTPGYFDFSGEVMEGLRVADAGIIVGSAKGGLSVGTEKAWKYLQERNMPRAIYIAKTDEENGDFNGAWQTLREKFGRSVCPVMMPLWDEEKHIETLLDIVYRRAYQLEGKRRKEVPIPADKQAVVDELYDQLCESVAETSEEFMDKYFSGEPFTQEEVIQGLHNGVKDLTLCPVVCGSAFTGLGTLTLLDCIIKLFPNPVEIPNRKGTDMHGNKVEIDITEDGAPYAFVFKTTSDQYGRYSYIKVISGRLTPDMSVVNARTGNITKLGHLYTMCGKKAAEVQEVCCGDIAAVSKLTDTRTNDSLCDPKHPVNLTAIPFPVANYTMAIAPKTKGQEDKVANGLVRLSEEDMTFHCVNNAETHQMVLTGTGDIQLSVLCAKLKDRFGVEVTLSPARVPYREKIRKKVKVEGKHKKQSGGHGQFGDVVLDIKPKPRGSGFEFHEKVVGGAVPRNYIGAVEEGVVDALTRGPLGFPVIDVDVTLTDGSYHSVDSSDLAFRTAARVGVSEALPQCQPVLLEPIHMVEIVCPTDATAKINAILSARRGQILGFDTREGWSGWDCVRATMPESEIGDLIVELRSATAGAGTFTRQFDRMAEVTGRAADQIIAAHRDAA